MSKPDTWMPFYVADYLADTSHLKLSEHGAYLLLIICYWRFAKALPDDDERLSRIVGLGKAEWRKVRPALEPFFYIFNGLWVHKRIEELLIEAESNAERNAKRAREAANKRWSEHASRNAKSDAPSMPQAMPSDMLATCPSPSPSTIKEKSPSSGDEALNADFDVWWSFYPRKVGKGGARRAYRAARKKADAPTLLSACRLFQAQCLGKDPQYVAHPTTWLNEERWLDEPTSSAAALPKDDETIRRNLRGWFDLGAPKASMKHPPGHPECKIPKHIQLEFKSDFERHGYEVAA